MYNFWQNKVCENAAWQYMQRDSFLNFLPVFKNVARAENLQ